jgi:hypothetical protein
MTNTAIATQNGVNVTPTYIVRRNGRKIPNKVFATYEKARQWVRRKLRSTRDMPGYVPISRDRPSILRVDVSDMKHRTPELALHGYSISKVEG